MTDQPLTPALTGLRIAVSPYLAGCKYALQVGNTVYLSPAQYDLMKHASPEELQTLLKNLPLKRMPAPPTFAELAAMPMVTQPPPVDEFARGIGVRYLLGRLGL